MTTQDTTGRIVMHYTNTGSRIVIAQDHGHYEGTRPELNCRALCRLEELDLAITHPAVVAVTDRANGYGCGWGDTGQLFPVSAQDIEALRAAATARELDEDVPDWWSRPEWRSPRGLTLAEEMEREDSIY